MQSYKSSSVGWTEKLMGQWFQRQSLGAFFVYLPRYGKGLKTKIDIVPVNDNNAMSAKSSVISLTSFPNTL